MRTRFYVDAEGHYIGGFAGAEPPKGAVEVPRAPEHASDKWEGGRWVSGPSPVPHEVTTRQAREALLDNGLLAAVDAYFAGLTGIEGERKRNLWHNSNTVERFSSATLEAGQMLGMTEAQMDALFIYAATR